MNYRYGPGKLLAIAEAGGVALVDADLAVDVRAAVAEALRSGGGFGSFVDALTAHFGASVSALPDFALALVEQQGTRVAVRGRLGAHAGAPISGAGVTTWTEAVVPLGTTVSLGDPAPALADDALVLTSGMVLASGIAVGSNVVPAAMGPHETSAAPPTFASQPEPDAPQAAPTPPPAPLVARTQSGMPVDDPGEPSGATTLAPLADTSGPAETDETALDEDTAFGGLWGSTAMSAGAASALPASMSSTSPTAASEEHPVPEQNQEQELAPEPEPEPEPAANQVPEPILAPRPRPAPREEADRPAGLSPTPVVDGMIAGLPAFLGGPPAGVTPEIADDLRPSAPTQPDTASAEKTPPTTSAPEPEAPATAPEALETGPPDELGDHDGATLAVSQIAELAPSAFGGDAPMAAASPPLPPTVGRAMLSTGQEVVIDRVVIIGRRPQASRVTGDLHRLVAVPSPQQDISRNHVELRPEGSSVVAVDLHTTNGSMLRRGASDPVRLHPGEPAVVVTGDIIDLGDGVTVTFVELP